MSNLSSTLSDIDSMMLRTEKRLLQCKRISYFWQIFFAGWGVFLIGLGVTKIDHPSAVGAFIVSLLCFYFAWSMRKDWKKIIDGNQSLLDECVENREEIISAIQNSKP